MGRHDTDIYGDYYPPNRQPEYEPSFVNEEFRIVWPPGYWEEYERLQAEARRLSRDPHACLVMKLNGKFQVRTTGLVMQDRGHLLKYVFGPEEEGRLEAWAAFIDSITTKPTKALKELAGKALKINMNRVRKPHGGK